MGEKKIKCWNVSKVIVGHINEEYQVKEPQLLKYCHMFMRLKDDFEEVQVKNIDRDHNERASKLAGLASDRKAGHLTMFIQETLQEPSIQLDECMNMYLGEKGWMINVFVYLTQGKLQKKPLEAKLLMTKAARYTIIAKDLYR